MSDVMMYDWLAFHRGSEGSFYETPVRVSRNGTVSTWLRTRRHSQRRRRLWQKLFILCVYR